MEQRTCSAGIESATVRAYVLGSLPHDARDAFEEHLAGCASCAERVVRAHAAVETIAALAPANGAADARRRRRGRLALFGIAAMLLAGITLWPLLRGPANPAPVFTDAPGTVTLDAAGHVTGIPGLGGPEEVRLARLLRQRRFVEPPELSLLRGSAAPLAGTVTRTSIAYVELTPRATAVRGAWSFAWPVVEGARGYAITVADAGGRVVRTSGPLAETRWSPPAPLEPGTYTWQVRALRADGDAWLPPPDAPPARVRVLDADEAERVEHELAACGGSHAARAATLVEHLLLDEARTELETLVALDPAGDLPRGLLAALDQLRSAPR